MAKLSELSQPASLSLSDLIPVLDVSDVTQSSQGTNKKATLQQIQDLIQGAEVVLPQLGTPLLVNGVPFKMRGINYSSNYSGGSSTNPWYVEVDQLDYDFDDIIAAGFNTIKIYADENNASDHLAALDKAHAKGLKVILLRFITYSVDYSVATGASNRTDALAKYTGMVTNLATHPAVIGVGFGNEQDYNLGVTPAEDWYTLVEAAMQAGRAILDQDSDSEDVFQFTATGDIGPITDTGLTYAPSVEVWASNVYRSTKIDLFEDLAEALIAAQKPFFLTEFGRSRTSNTQSVQDNQAVEDLSLFQQIESLYPYVAGYCFFKYTDSVAPGTVFGITAPQTQGVYATRTHYAAYDKIKAYLTGYGYGAGAYVMRTGDTVRGPLYVHSSNSKAFLVGQNGQTNPAFQVQTDTASSATGIKITSKAAGSGILLEAISSGTNEDLILKSKAAGSIILAPGTDGVNAILFKNAAQNATYMRIDTTNQRVGILKTSPAATLDVGGGIRGDTASANAFIIGPNGATNPTLRIDTSATDAATGLLITSQAAAGGIAVAVTSSGTDEDLKIDAKGAGILKLQTIATGTIQMGASVTMADGKNIVLNATTGTKIGTATTQKLSFFNATPIVQPATSGSASTLVGGGGSALTDTDTFDGWTIAKVVKALRQLGLLA